MKHFVSHSYTIIAKTSLSSRSEQRHRQGALLRITFDDGLVGYADCHPWIELGDAPLDQQIALLKNGAMTPLTRQSCRFARLDAEARALGRNLLTGLSIPPSHFLVNNIENLKIDQLQDLQDQEFTHFKVKMGRNLLKEVRHFKALAESDLGKQFKWRFDFNGSLNFQAFVEFLEAVDGYLDLIDFIEDPFLFNIEQWSFIQKRFRVTLACDQWATQALGIPQAACVLILKPAIHHEDDFMKLKSEKQRIVVTSFLDHPVGQSSAAYVAGKINLSQSSSPCGLMSHSAYEINPFSSCLPFQGPYFHGATGFGLGFDNLLENLDWK